MLSPWTSAPTSLTAAPGSNKKRNNENKVVTAAFAPLGGSTSTPTSTPTSTSLCLATSHRTAFLSERRRSDGSVGRWKEDPSRLCDAKPGRSAAFDLGGGPLPMTSPSPGGDGLVYALRGDGSELVVWTDGGDNANQDDKAGADDVGIMMGSGGGGKKGKKRAKASTVITRQRVPLPDSRHAATMEPFAVTVHVKGNGNDDGAQLAIEGAAGCLRETSVGEPWIVARARVVDAASTEPVPLQWLPIKGEQLKKNNKNNRNNNTNKDPSKVERVLASRAHATAVDDNNSNSRGPRLISVVVHVRSVLLLTDGAIIMRSRAINMTLKTNHGAAAATISTATTVVADHQHDLTIAHPLPEGGARDGLHVTMDAVTSGGRVHVIHRDSNANADAAGSDKWTCVSITTPIKPGERSRSNDADAEPPKTSGFTLSNQSDKSGDSSTVVGLGSTGRGGSILAILFKTRLSSSSFEYRLRIVDVRRKAELDSLSWVEAEQDANNDSKTSHGRDFDFEDLVRGTRCLGMTTDEYGDGGSIALILARGTAGTVEVVSSRVGASPTTKGVGPSLAAALRASSALPFRPAVISNAPAVVSPPASPSSGVDRRVESALASLAEVKATIVDTVAANKKKRATMTKKSKKKKRRSGNTGDDGIAALIGSWERAYDDAILEIRGAQEGDARGRECAAPPSRFTDAAFDQTAGLLLALRTKDDDTDGEEVMLQYEAIRVLLRILRTGHVSARGAGFDAPHPSSSGNDPSLLSAVLRACPPPASTPSGTPSEGTDGSTALDVVRAILSDVRDLPERVLISMLRFVMRDVSSDDAAAHYCDNADLVDKRGAKLAVKYRAAKVALVKAATDSASNKNKSDDSESKTEEDELVTRLSGELLSETLLDVTARSATYSLINPAFLTGAMRSGLRDDEREALALALARLLRSGRCGHGGTKRKRGHDTRTASSLTAGVVRWMSSLADALGGGTGSPVSTHATAEAMRKAARLASDQAELGNDLSEAMDYLFGVGGGGGSIATTVIAPLTEPARVPSRVPRDELSGRSVVPAYSVERLVF